MKTNWSLAHTWRMPRVHLKHINVRRPNPFVGWEQKVHLSLFLLFVAAWLMLLTNLWIPAPWFGSRHRLNGLLVLAGAASTIASLCRQLPAQNAIFGAVLIGLVSGAVQALNASLAIPFGPMEYHRENIGQLMFGALPWAAPLIWVITILNARGVARLILRSHRRNHYYGFWVMGVTVLLVTILQFSLEPFATIGEGFWTWTPTKLRSSWYSTPWTNFLGGAVMSLLILLFVTPLFINKSPNPKPPAYHPLVLWQLCSGLFLTGMLVHHVWGASVFILAQMALVTAAAALGAGRSIDPRKTKPTSASPASTA